MYIVSFPCFKFDETEMKKMTNTKLFVLVLNRYRETRSDTPNTNKNERLHQKTQNLVKNHMVPEHHTHDMPHSR